MQDNNRNIKELLNRTDYGLMSVQDNDFIQDDLNSQDFQFSSLCSIFVFTLAFTPRIRPQCFFLC